MFKRGQVEHLLTMANLKFKKIPYLRPALLCIGARQNLILYILYAMQFVVQWIETPELVNSFVIFQSLLWRGVICVW